jgi:hypothetical protein
MASYTVNRRGVAQVRRLIRAKQYVLNSEWGSVQPKAATENAYLKEHEWQDYGGWFLGLTEGATEETKARYAFVYGDFRRLHRSGLIACLYRAAEWRHTEVLRAAYKLLEELDRATA